MNAPVLETPLILPRQQKKVSACSIPLHCRVSNWQESTFPLENNFKICARIVWFGHQDPDFKSALKVTLKEIHPELIQLSKSIKKATTIICLVFQ